MGLVTFIILFGPAMEYVGPNMTPPASHVTQKNENHGQNGLNFRLHGQNTSNRCDICHVTLRKTPLFHFFRFKFIIFLLNAIFFNYARSTCFQIDGW